MKVSKSFRKSVFVMVSLVSTSIFFNPIESNANQETIVANVASQAYGTSYWKSSNIREWLNSDSESVSYTMNKPSYHSEAGFLSNFREDEKNAIAVTRRRIPQTNAYPQTSEGGTEDMAMSNPSNSTRFSFENIIDKWMNYKYYKTNDKVFLLSIPELFFYYESRFDSNAIQYSDEAKRRIPNPTGIWMTSSGYITGTNEDTLFTIDSYGGYYRSVASYKGGVVPAMHIKPDYVFQDGRRASDLSIGDKVLFGEYNYYDMEWIVINKTSNGYPLLLSSKVIDDKEYNNPSSVILKESNYINFNSPEVDISDNYNIFGVNGDNVTPNMVIENNDELFQDKDTSYSIILNSSDSSGIDYVILPNGNKIYNNDSISYSIQSNGTYTFIASDMNGNKRRLLIPIGNIHSKPQIMVQPSTTEWTNQNIEVDIFSSGNESSFIQESIQYDRDSYLDDRAWNNYDSYANRRIKISGSVEVLNNYGGDRNKGVGIGVYYRNMYKTEGGDYFLGHSWSKGKHLTIGEIQDAGKLDFSFEITVPSDYYMNLKPWTNIDVPHGNSDYMLKWSNIQYTLADSENYDIERIVLPNGQEVYNNEYTDVITEAGEYSYRIFDKSGNLHIKHVKALIDRNAPKLRVSYNNDYTNYDLNIGVSIREDESGLYHLELPDGTTTNKNRLNYYAKENGELTFTAIDRAGNISTKTVNITNVDKEKPRIEGELNYSPDGNSATIRISTDDTISGVNFIQKYNGEMILNQNTLVDTVSKGGTYKYTVFDNAGNSSIFSINVDRIDNSLISGINTAEYKLEGSTSKGWSPLIDKITIVNEGTTIATIRATDKAGNKREISTTIKVDKTSPNLLHSITYNNDYSLATINLTGNDSLSGLDSIVLGDGSVIKTSEYSFTTDKNGQYLITAIDKAGNINFISVLVDKLDGSVTSGIKEIQYKLDGATQQGWTKYTSQFKIVNEGTTIVTAKSIDNANNSSDEVTLEVKVDKTKPTENKITIRVLK